MPKYHSQLLGQLRIKNIIIATYLKSVNLGATILKGIEKITQLSDLSQQCNVEE